MTKAAESKKIMIVVGESSGDSHAAQLVREMRNAEADTTFEFFGSTGPKLRALEVDTVVSADELAVVGIAEIAKVFPMFWRAFKDLQKAADERKPDAVILVDFPEFNLKFARALKRKLNTKIIYYISPQIWAWRKYRVRTIRKYVDLLLTILPFEKDWYAKQGVENVEYVGNPLVGKVAFQNEKDAFCAKYGLDAEQPIIALLPGSRRTEIRHILPEMLKTARLMRQDKPNVQFVVAAAEGRAAVISEMLGSEHFFTVVENETYDALNAADAAAVASGTATLETGMIGTPMAIVYKGTEINNKLLRPLISVEHFGLINLIAGERIATELIQQEFTAEVLSCELFSLLEPAKNLEIREKLKAATAKLGSGDASKRAAEAVIRELG